MNKVKKPLVFLALFLLIMLPLFGLLFVKYSPFLLRTPVYYCQHLWCSTLIKISSLLGTTIFRILLITILITFIKTVVSFYKIFRLRRSLLPHFGHNLKLESAERELNLTKKIMVVEHKDPFAFCLGFLHSKIVISSSLVKLLNEPELKAVLAHEKYHLEHKDALIMSITRFFESLFPFFPLLKDQLSLLSLDREIKADNNALVSLGDKKPLATTLQKLLSFEILPAYTTFPSFLNSEKQLEIRIKTLMEKPFSFRSYSRKNIGLSLGVLILLLVLVLLPVRTVNITAASAKEVVTCLNNEACIKACSLEKQNDSLFEKLHPNR